MGQTTVRDLRDAWVSETILFNLLLVFLIFHLLIFLSFHFHLEAASFT